MESESTPDLVIGIDFGMTQTGVAYCTHPWTNVKTFQQWGLIVSEVANKVPSRIAYSLQTGRVIGWGFNCDADDPNADIQEYFKLYLDPEYQDDYDGVSNADAQRYYRDYLYLVHEHVVKYFVERTPNFASMKVEFIFSVPTTWRNPALIHDLEVIIRQAGFGSDGPRHVASITLTEAEAAAVNVIADYVRRDDVICICDAGGGTTDVNILKLISDRGDPIKLRPLSKVEGAPVGSALIDIRVQQFLEERLTSVANMLSSPVQEVAERMLQGRFERFKCMFGTNVANSPALSLEIPGLPAGINVPRASIQNSHIEVSQDFLQKLFDEQVAGIIQLLMEQIRDLQTIAPRERISYLVLSGGLGSSPYVRGRVKAYFEYDAKNTLTNATGMHMLLAEDPQLAVVLGLVTERAQAHGQRLKAITSRRARVSYGVVVNQLWDPIRHRGQPMHRDPRDKKQWALNQIEWLIREGDEVDDQGVSKHVRAKLKKTQLSQPWRAQFVISMEKRDRLPTNVTASTVRTLCIVEADLRFIDRITKNGHWWQIGQRYELAEFDLKLIAGSADLKFQLWNNGKLITGHNESVAIDWGLGAPVIEQRDQFDV